MLLLSKKQKTAILFLVWATFLVGAWFASPVVVRAVLRSQSYITHSIGPSRISGGEYAQARADIIRLLKDSARAKMKGARDEVVDLYLQAATRLEALGQYAKAYQYVAPILVHDPKNGKALFQKAVLFESLAPTAGALDAWRAVLDRDPTENAAYEHLATMTEYAARDFSQANGIYVEGLVRGGNAPSLMRAYADFLERQGEKSTALLYWKALAQRSPDDENAQNHVRALERYGAAPLP
ncbi:hypothetical protein HY732_03820 [Candidatus Uhrbacteria bacterium]|nr:hypothetical protein [Candidatus Uhrbacteria bacterium]